MMQLNSTNKNFLIKSFSFVAAANILTKPLWVLLFIFAARKLGTHQFGIYSLAFSIVSILTLFFELSLDYILVREYNLYKEKINNIFSSIIFLRLVVISFLYIGLFVYAFLNNLFSDVLFYSVILLFTFQVITYFLSFYKAIISMFQDFKLFSVMMIIEKMLIIILGFLALFIGCYLIGFLFAILIANLISLFVFVFIIKKKKIKFVYVKIDDILSIFRLALPFFFINIFIVIYFRLDILLLNYIINDKHIIGIYGSLHRLIEMYVLIPAIFMSMGYPVITANYFENREFSLKYTIKIINFLLALSIFIAVVVSTNSNYLNKLIYGVQYYEGGKGLIFLIWVIVPNSINFVLGNLVIIIKKEKISILILGIGSFFNIILNLILIKYFSFVGACITALLSELIIFFLYTYFITKFYGNIDLINTNIKIVSISIIVVLFNLIFNYIFKYNPLINISLNALLSLVLLLAFKIVNINDFIDLINLVKVKRNS